MAYNTKKTKNSVTRSAWGWRGIGFHEIRLEAGFKPAYLFTQFFLCLSIGTLFFFSRRVSLDIIFRERRYRKVLWTSVPWSKFWATLVDTIQDDFGLFSVKTLTLSNRIKYFLSKSTGTCIRFVQHTSI